MNDIPKSFEMRRGWTGWNSSARLSLPHKGAFAMRLLSILQLSTVQIDCLAQLSTPGLEIKDHIKAAKRRTSSQSLQRNLRKI